jgi:hypothetical protein
VKTMVKSTFEVSKNSLNMIIVGKTRTMHKKTCLLDGIREFRMGESKIL